MEVGGREPGDESRTDAIAIRSEEVDVVGDVDEGDDVEADDIAPIASTIVASVTNSAVDDELEKFRENWQREVHAAAAAAGAPSGRPEQPRASAGTNTEPVDDDRVDAEDAAKEALLAQALAWHLEAERLESDGDTHKALVLYRKAHRVDPNVELRAHEYRSEMYEQRKRDAAGATAASVGVLHAESGGDDNTVESPGRVNITDIHSHMRQLPFEWLYVQSGGGGTAVARSGGGSTAVRGSAPPTRIGSLPPELLVRILVLLFERTRDVARLLQVGEVCRAFFKVTQDDELWRQIGRLIWRDAPRGTTPTPPLATRWKSARHMCITRPRALVHGVYITRYQYQRAGERTWDEFYTPQHLVTYYRYIRFWPDGSVVVVTSADRPEIVVPKLKHPASLGKLAQCFSGTYDIADDRINLRVSKIAEVGTPQEQGLARNRGAPARPSMLHLHVTARIENRRQGYSNRLVVVRYTTTVVRGDGERQSMSQDITKFLPFVFSRVKSMDVQQ